MIIYYRFKRMIFLCLILVTANLVQARTGKVELTVGGTPELREMLSLRLTEVVNSLREKQWDTIKPYFSTEGMKSLLEIVDVSHCRNKNPLARTKLLSLPRGGYEVRDIEVEVDLRGTKGLSTQSLVFTFDEAGVIQDVKFALEKNHYKDLIEKREQLKDFAFRQEILSFLEIFRTAYNKKDLEFLRKVYSEDALIIVGKVLKVKPNSNDFLDKNLILKDKIILIKTNKKQYLESLEKNFKTNSFIDIRFDSIQVTQSDKDPCVYGVMLEQTWKSSTYSDFGYLFLMLDFRDRENPLIHVRSWQPEPFADGRVINLGDFVVPSAPQKN